MYYHCRDIAKQHIIVWAYAKYCIAARAIRRHPVFTFSVSSISTCPVQLALLDDKDQRRKTLSVIMMLTTSLPLPLHIVHNINLHAIANSRPATKPSHLPRYELRIILTSAWSWCSPHTAVHSEHLLELEINASRHPTPSASHQYRQQFQKTYPILAWDPRIQGASYTLTRGAWISHAGGFLLWGRPRNEASYYWYHVGGVSTTCCASGARCT